ncbi:MAG TPA: SDR family oxidoreductase [Gaiellaceae bacterium]|nr:SDR family oxidoreductase [Gaiellaceae bacterium]
MKLLLLGGPRFLGRAVIEAALERGHAVTTFNRGLTSPELFPEVEELRGDREGSLDALRGRRWDAVVDTSGYVPGVVREAAKLLAGGAERYAFVSSVSYYADYREPRTEDDPPAELGGAPADRLLDDYSNYGALKALCEQEVRAAFGERALLVRPGLIVGPHDPTDRFTYWPHRARRGGPILAPAPPGSPVQLVDVRDLAGWIVRLLEQGVGGTFNATSPPGAITFGSMLEACGAANVVWVDEAFLLAEGIEGWMDVPCWLPSTATDWACFQRVDVSRAVAAGLTFRPLGETAQGVPEWTGKAGLSPEREAELLAAWQLVAA